MAADGGEESRARLLAASRQVEERHYRQPAMAQEPSIPSLEKLLAGASVLKPVHRLCLTLRYILGMSLSEIAAQTGLYETQVKGHLQYGRRLLREQYRKVS